MTELYKLTTQDWLTRKGWSNETKWGPGVEHKALGKGFLCTSGFIHAYTHPKLAVLLNPIYSDIENPVLWRCEGKVVKSDRGLKVGCRRLKTVEIIDLPVIAREQRIKFAILCALEAHKDAEYGDWASDYVDWAKAWLDGRDRSIDTVRTLLKQETFLPLCFMYVLWAVKSRSEWENKAFVADAIDEAADRSKNPLDLIKLVKQI
jgi:hypothetical protein